ncbi:MAG TPA: sigma-70 family RNA polymerase sigma factor [Pyrinomonadaceae bacterium]|nr:sigma-70 family RNA polymerase sigma factor [Pyrinomonadaceae bacterium]
MSESQQITELLLDWGKGNEVALDILMPIVEKELRQIAHQYMRREENHTLQTTALINEAYLKLIDQKRTDWQNRSHFFAVSAQIMRRVLLNYARQSNADKRGGSDFQMINIEDEIILTPKKSEQLIALDEALEKLAKIDKVKSRVVEFRYFGGLTINETAEALNISAPMVSLHWRFARAWLQKEIEEKM